MRPIDADELLEHLEACLHNGRPLSNLYDLSEIVRYVKSMPTIAASPWHRVEEELPDLLQFVVVCNDEGKCVVAQYVGYQTDSLTPWRIAYTMYDTDIYDEKECGPVRYWMPIPSPPVNKMFTK